MATAAPAPATLGTRFRTIQSQTNSVPFDAGNTRSVELPRSFPYKSIRVRLRGSINSGSQSGSLADFNPLGLIKKLDILADGRKQIVSAAGVDLYRLSNIYNGKAGELVPAGTSASATSAGFEIHFEAARMLSPIMSYFDPRPYEKVECRVQWGTTADMFSTVGTSAMGAESALDLQCVQSAAGEEQIGFNRLILYDEYAFAASPVSSFTINVPRAGLLAGVLLAVRTTTAPAPTNVFFQNATATSSNIFGTISLKSDNNFLHADTLNATSLQTSNVYNYLLDSNTGGTNMGQGIVGNYFLDLTEDGLITSPINTFDLNVLQLILTSQASLATACTIRVTYIFFEPIVAA